jgi:tetratricopeptide (TPR) repeat protein
MKISLILIISLFSVLSFQSFAQPAKKKPPVNIKEIQKLEAEAKKEFENQEYTLAQPLYEKLDSINPKTGKYTYPLAICYINNDLNRKALPYIELCLKRSSSMPAALNYYAGRTFHLCHRFDEAIRYYSRYRDFLKKSTDKNSKKIILNVNRLIEMCNNGKELMKRKLSIEVFNISKNINSKYPDYRPVVSLDEGEIIFTSNRPNTTGGQKNEAGIYNEDIYISYRSDSGWSKPAQMSGNINTNGNDAAVSISANGKKLIIYRYEKKNLMSKASGDLYISELIDGKWSKAVRLPNTINSPGWEPSACLSQDENTMYFTSDREGGIGGTDIYVVKKLSDGTWSLPQNLGPQINTAGDEDSPSIQPDGLTLYFSSSGLKSMGGYDIFVTKYDEDKKKWSQPENVGYPINTAHDDLYFSWSEDGKRVYFSSLRPEGMGEKDLYYAVIHEELAGTMIVKGLVTDSITSQPLETKIKVMGKGSKQIVGIFNSDKTGKYLITLDEGKDYNVLIEAEGYEPFTYATDLTELQEYGELNKSILLKPKK